MKRWLRSHPALLVRRLALLYVVLALCRAVFYLYNRALIGPIPGAEFGPLLRGALLFDTASVLYANAPFILLALLPTPLRERRWYRALLFWYYTAVNAVLVVALNLADAVYFHYTQKRFTAEELFFADNDNSLALALRFAAENWYLVLAGIGLIVLLVKGYGRRHPTRIAASPRLGLLPGQYRPAAARSAPHGGRHPGRNDAGPPARSPCRTPRSMPRPASGPT